MCPAATLSLRGWSRRRRVSSRVASLPCACRQDPELPAVLRFLSGAHRSSRFAERRGAVRGARSGRSGAEGGASGEARSASYGSICSIPYFATQKSQLVGNHCEIATRQTRPHGHAHAPTVTPGHSLVYTQLTRTVTARPAREPKTCVVPAPTRPSALAVASPPSTHRVATHQFQLHATLHGMSSR